MYCERHLASRWVKCLCRCTYSDGVAAVLSYTRSIKFQVKMNAIKEFSFILWIKFVASHSLSLSLSLWLADACTSTVSLSVRATAFSRSFEDSHAQHHRLASIKERRSKRVCAPFAHLLCNSNESRWHILWHITTATTAPAAATKTKNDKHQKKSLHARYGRCVRARLKISQPAEA